MLSAAKSEPKVAFVDLYSLFLQRLESTNVLKIFHKIGGQVGQSNGSKIKTIVTEKIPARRCELAQN